MPQITEEFIEQLASNWIDISILTDKDNNSVLILICKNIDYQAAWYNSLVDCIYELMIYIEDDGRYTISIEFADAKTAISLKYALTSKEWPELTWLNNGKVKWVTTGIWVEDTSISNYYRPLLPLFPKMMNN